MHQDNIFLKISFSLDTAYCFYLMFPSIQIVGILVCLQQPQTLVFPLQVWKTLNVHNLKPITFYINFSVFSACVCQILLQPHWWTSSITAALHKALYWFTIQNSEWRQTSIKVPATFWWGHQIFMPNRTHNTHYW